MQFFVNIQIRRFQYIICAMREDLIIFKYDCVNLFFYTLDEYTGNGQNMVYYKCIYFMRF